MFLLTAPVYLGNSLNWALFGMLTVQVYRFYNLFPKERFLLKLFVATIYIVESAHALLLIAFGWDYLVSGWGQSSAVENIPPPGLAQPIITGIISGIVQTFYAWRIWTLGNSIWAHIASVVIVLVALLSSVTSITAGIMFCFVQDIAGEVRLAPAVNVYLSAGVAADILIAFFMSLILIRARKITPFKKTEALITKLLIASIETGAVTAVTALVDLALFIRLPEFNFHLCPSLMLSQLYSNAALASLNQRKDLGFGTSHLSYNTNSGGTNVESHQLALVPRSNDLEARGVHISTATEVHGEQDTFHKKNVEI